MKFIDANIFLTVLVKPVNEIEEMKERACRALFDRILEGEEQAHTHPTIVAEVIFVLVSPRKYRMSIPDTSRRVRPLVELAGLHLPDKAALLRALNLWPSFPQLDFEDIFAVALIEGDNPGEIYSYDHHFDRVPGIARVEPE